VIDMRDPHPESTAAATRPLLRFVRHGATAANLAGLRCGGDLDPPLTTLGRQQAVLAAAVIAQLQPPVGVIVTSDLERTRETAAIIAESLPDVPIVIETGFGERHLGEWNLKPLGLTEPWLKAGQTPPGGESNDLFIRRVADAVRAIAHRVDCNPLIVGSKGVARAMGQITGTAERLELDNGVIAEFEYAAFRIHGTDGFQGSLK
jgi:probable phosphoglycerate mutase